VRSVFQRRYLFDFLFWLMYAVFMILESQGYAKSKGLLFCIPPLLIYFALMAILVYTNILVLIPLLSRKKIALYIISVLLLIVFYTLARSLNQQYWDAIVWPKDIMKVTDYFHWNIIYGFWFTIISSMLFFTQKWTEQRQQVKNIQITQLQTELKYLRAQVNPHFLFNGLNTIYGSIDINNQQARDILLQFSDLLRYNLYEADVDWVDLGKEALHLQNYVALQRARSNNNLQIELTTSITDNTIKVAPLIFIVFVENAFKYSSRDDGRINLIKISLQQSGNQVTFTCSNSYDADAEQTGGIGLNNVKRRLELLYKDRYTLTINTDQSTYYLQLILFV
jgi:signal transduction histidine kinase